MIKPIESKLPLPNTILVSEQNQKCCNIDYDPADIIVLNVFL